MYLALYRKYRPLTFDDVVSQEHITRTLENQISTKQYTHAYLFTGPRATGKTSCAKILAKALNCEHPQNGSPCLKCESCKTIESGTPDIVEIDAASNNGVDDVRAIRDEINYLPVNCRLRVYIIDEVHMLSNSAFNALLKTVEEPPEHVVFILATTESHKVPATILSRCQRFEFKRIDVIGNTNRLLEVARRENVNLDESAAKLIARHSDGGLRDSLSLLDTCLSVVSEKDSVTVEVVSKCAGIPNSEHLFTFTDYILSENAADSLKLLGKLHSDGKDMGRFTDEMIYHFRNLMLIKVMPENDSTDILDEEKYRDYAEKIPLSSIMRALDILEECFEKLNRSHERRILVEICLIHLTTPSLDISEKALSQRISKLEMLFESGAKILPQVVPEKTVRIPEKPQENISDVSDISEDIEIPLPEEPPLMTENLAADYWHDILTFLPPYLAMLIENVKAEITGEFLCVYGNDLHGGILSNSDNIALLEAAAANVIGKPMKIRFIEVKEDNNNKKDNNESEITKFLNFIKEKGIDLKIK